MKQIIGALSNRILREISSVIVLVTLWMINFRGAFKSGFVFTMSPDNEYDLAQMFAAISRNWKSGVVPIRLDEFMLGFPIYNWSSMTPWYPFYGFLTSDYSNFQNSIQTMSNLVSLHILLAMLNLYYLMRTLKVSRIPSIVAASLFGLSADMFSYSVWLIIVAPYAWFPLVIAGAIKILKFGEFKSGGTVLIMSFVLMILASPSQPIIHTALFIFVLCSLFLLEKQFETLKIRFARVNYVFALCGLAGIISSPVLLPQALNLSKWIRWIGDFNPITMDMKIPFPAFNYWRLHLHDASQILFNEKLIMVGSSFVGPLAIIIAITVLSRKLNFLERTLIFVGAYGLISAFGSDLGLVYLNYHVPLINAVREPTRHLFLFQFAITVLVGLGLDSLRNCQIEASGKRNKTVLTLSGLICLFFTFYGINSIQAGITQKSILAIFLVVFALFVVSINLNVLRVTKVSWLCLPALILAFHFTSVSWTPPYKFSDSEYSKETFKDLDQIYKLVGELDPTRNYRTIADGELKKGFVAMQGTYRNVRTTQYYLNPAPIQQAIDVDFNDAGFGGFRDLKFKYFSLIGGRYYICDTCDEIINLNYSFLEKKGKFNLYINKDAKPILYSSQKTQNALGRTDFLQKFRESNEDLALVETNHGELNPSSSEPCQIKVLNRNTLGLKARIACKSDSIIVLNEYFDGNWRAFLNGKKVEVHKANINQNGSFVNRGNYLLEFKYQPRDFYEGLILSIFGLLILLVFICINHIPTRRIKKKILKGTE